MSFGVKYNLKTHLIKKHQIGTDETDRETTNAASVSDNRKEADICQATTVSGGSKEPIVISDDNDDEQEAEMESTIDDEHQDQGNSYP